eukprot:6177269-Pleurochrysis_carterae.AAC.1
MRLPASFSRAAAHLVHVYLLLILLYVPLALFCDRSRCRSPPLKIRRSTTTTTRLATCTFCCAKKRWDPFDSSSVASKRDAARTAFCRVQALGGALAARWVIANAAITTAGGWRVLKDLSQRSPRQKVPLSLVMRSTMASTGVNDQRAIAHCSQTTPYVMRPLGQSRQQRLRASFCSWFETRHGAKKAARLLVQLVLAEMHWLSANLDLRDLAS